MFRINIIRNSSTLSREKKKILTIDANSADLMDTLKWSRRTVCFPVVWRGFLELL